MTSGLDIVTKDAGEQVRSGRARDTGEEALVALYRLAQMVRVHDVENQAFARALDQTHRAVVYYSLHAGSDLVILFAERVVLIGGQLLQGTRAAYEAACLKAAPARKNRHARPARRPGLQERPPAKSYVC